MGCRTIVLCLIAVSFLKSVSSESLFNEDLYKNVLDNVTCRRHMRDWEIRFFLDAGFRIPQSIALGSQGSLGNYHQCLSIAQQKYNNTNDVIFGKYCMINLPIRNDTNASQLNLGPYPGLNGSLFELINIKEDVMKAIDDTQRLRRAVGIFTGNPNVGDIPEKGSLAVKLAVCIPKSCTTHDVFGWFTDALPIPVKYVDQYCRLPNDKVFSTGDRIAVAIIVIIGILTALSTGYDLYNVFVLKKDPAEIHKVLTCCSVYTNTNRLLNFANTSGNIECLDGIRSISILWIVLAHSFSQVMSITLVNSLTTKEWSESLDAVWLQSAVLSVDTFFLMSGMLVVYTTIKKMGTQMTFLKNLHFFYLQRYLRMFPLLAAAVLFQASLAHHSGDGPTWPTITGNVEDCRKYWWSALLYIQNFYIHDYGVCLTHTWYLSVDMQLHIVSPLVLYWLLSNRRSAWYALGGALGVSLFITMVYCYAKSFPGVTILGIPDNAKMVLFFKQYYVNTMTRSPAFVVGMILGYLLHIWKENPIEIPKWCVALGWVASFALGLGMIFCSYPGAKMSQFWLNFWNTFMRPLWTVAVGWVVFACFMGYGGPVNWFLSLRIWKFLGRVSYSLYLFHYPIQTIIRLDSAVPLIVSKTSVIYTFFTDLSISLMVATVLFVVVDGPFSTLYKIYFGDRIRASEPRPPSPTSVALASTSTPRENENEIID